MGEGELKAVTPRVTQNQRERHSANRQIAGLRRDKLRPLILAESVIDPFLGKGCVVGGDDNINTRPAHSAAPLA